VGYDEYIMVTILSSIDNSQRNDEWADLSKPLDQQGDWTNVVWSFNDMKRVGDFAVTLPSFELKTVSEVMEGYRLPTVYCGSSEKAIESFCHFGVVAWYPYEHLNVGGGFRHCYAYFPDETYFNEYTMAWIARHCSDYGDEAMIPTLESLKEAWLRGIMPPKPKPKHEYFMEGVKKNTEAGIPGLVRFEKPKGALEYLKGETCEFYVNERDGKTELCIFTPDNPKAWDNMRGDHILINSKGESALKGESDTVKIIRLPN
jgi:hypothetical protein